MSLHGILSCSIPDEPCYRARQAPPRIDDDDDDEVTVERRPGARRKIAPATRKRVVDYLRRHPGSCVLEMSFGLEVTSNLIYQVTRELCAEGLAVKRRAYGAPRAVPAMYTLTARAA